MQQGTKTKICRWLRSNFTGLFRSQRGRWTFISRFWQNTWRVQVIAVSLISGVERGRQWFKGTRRPQLREKSFHPPKLAFHPPYPSQATRWFGGMKEGRRRKSTDKEGYRSRNDKTRPTSQREPFGTPSWKVEGDRAFRTGCFDPVRIVHLRSTGNRRQISIHFKGWYEKNKWKCLFSNAATYLFVHQDIFNIF